MNRQKTLLGVLAAAGMLCAGSLLPPEAFAGKDKKTDKRAERRAFYTAPPTIPHEVEERGSRHCLDCHESVVDLGDRISVATPHPQLSSCQQCHVVNQKIVPVKTNWKGLKEPKKGVRTHPKAPPTIPHRTFLREKCLSCHGPDNPDKKLRTLHPERKSCRQCHIVGAKTEF